MTRRRIGYSLRVLGMLLGMLLMLGCSFGGFDDKTTIPHSNNSGSDTDTIIKGIVSKGPFQSGSIEIYSLNSGGNATLLRQTVVGPFGNYSGRVAATRPVDSGGYTGVVLVKAYGSYLDEATGTTLTIPAQQPLRALLANPSGPDVVAAVTPLTELAARQVLEGGKTVAATDVTSANSLISQLFRVDIMATEPVRADFSDSGFGNALTSQQQMDYTLALAAISWLGREAGSLSTALAELNAAIKSGTMNAETARSFKKALDDFLASDKNLTMVSDSALTNLVNAGGPTRKVKLSLSGEVPTGTTISGVRLTLNLPPGVTVRSNFLKKPIQVLEGTVAASSTIAANSYVDAQYVPATAGHPAQVVVSLMTPGNIAMGELLSILCDFPPGANPQPGDFSVSGVMITDGERGAPVSGVGIPMPVVLE